MWYRWPGHFTGVCPFLAASLLLRWKELSEPIRLGIPKWNATEFFSTMSVLLGLVLLLILMARLPEGQWEELRGTWYFTGVLWLFLLAVLTTGFLREKSEAQQNNGQPSSEATVPREGS